MYANDKGQGQYQGNSNVSSNNDFSQSGPKTELSQGSGYSHQYNLSNNNSLNDYSNSNNNNSSNNHNYNYSSNGSNNNNGSSDNNNNNNNNINNINYNNINYNSNNNNNSNNHVQRNSLPQQQYQQHYFNQQQYQQQQQQHHHQQQHQQQYQQQQQPQAQQLPQAQQQLQQLQHLQHQPSIQPSLQPAPIEIHDPYQEQYVPQLFQLSNNSDSQLPKDQPSPQNRHSYHQQSPTQRQSLPPNQTGSHLQQQQQQRHLSVQPSAMEPSPQPHLSSPSVPAQPRQLSPAQQTQQQQQQQPSRDASQTPMREFTIVALGKSGEGKSTLLNSILGREIFTAKPSVNEVTQHVDRAANHFLNIPSNPVMHCIDTPSFNGKMHDPNRVKELGALLTKVASGVDAFLFVIKCTRYRYDNTFHQTLQTYQTLLTRDFWSKLMIVFTHATPELLPSSQARVPLMAWSREIQERFQLDAPPTTLFAMDYARFPYPSGGAQDFWEKLMELDANTEPYCHQPFLESFGNGIAVEGYVQRIKGHLAVFEPSFFEAQAEGQYKEMEQKKRKQGKTFGLFKRHTHSSR
ncbi:hypothetical protein BGW38_004335 [Lunasporangiospora selenospora]|uniref:AIG1-type G domain-containing protein n=1 Tax=Lunasporangiospora selenospora TaxID=979761 RepID=A0A9P6G0T8_9FUNG|nr:hypothetical protein BGW38_004335 [Lunasporangiospora selenospora]